MSGITLIDVQHVPGKGSLAVTDGERTVFGPSTLSACRQFIVEQYELRQAARNSETNALRRAFA